MITYQDIRDVHLEISTLCNASCPWCPRTFWGYPYNGGYPEVYMSLNQAKKIFRSDFLDQLITIRVNGNYGDIVMNPDGVEIIEYFTRDRGNLTVTISTNGGARNRDFWQRLAHTGAIIKFAIDGLEDTHHLYRQNTVWKQIIHNAETFINSGGRAIWQMIRFKHNQHQIKDCQQMSSDLGFHEFKLVDDGRNTAPVFNKHGDLVHILGNYRGETSFPLLFHKKLNDAVLLEDILLNKHPRTNISCKAKNLNSIYIAANGEVSPCCWTGFYPSTYGKGQYHQAANAQLQPLIHKNNALKYPLEQCINWFSEIEKSWKITDYNQGRLVICDDNCGHD